MAEISQCQFKSNGQIYSLVVTLTHASVSSLPIDIGQISKLTIENEVNKFFLTGELIVTDNYGKIDQFIDKQYVKCRVLLNQIEQKFDGRITLQKSSETNKLFHDFIVQNIAIINRSKSAITYKLSLVGENILKCMALIQYSNYSLKEEDQNAFKILQACMKLANLNVNKVSFDKIKSDAAFSYITNENDNIQTVFKYLMSKVCYYDKRDDSFKMLVYDESTDTYFLFDTKSKLTLSGISTVVISPMKGTKETTLSEVQAQLGSITVVKQSDIFKSTMTHALDKYDYSKNQFITNSIENKSIVNYFNNTLAEDNLTAKYKAISNTELKFQQAGTYWNNDYDIYDDMMTSLTKSNAIIVNVAGQILRKPASYVTVAIDRDDNTPTEDNREALKESYDRYKGLEGLWITSRVTHIIQPSVENCPYTQNLALFRNFTNKK